MHTHTHTRTHNVVLAYLTFSCDLLVCTQESFKRTVMHMLCSMSCETKRITLRQENIENKLERIESLLLRLPVQPVPLPTPSNQATPFSPPPPVHQFQSSTPPPPAPPTDPPGSPCISPITVTPVQLFPREPLQEVSTESIMAAKRRSCSRPNFSANLVREMFTIEERRSSNVKGKAGKKQLDPCRMQRVHDVSFDVFQLNNGENMETAWKACIKSIDEAGRRLNRSKIGKENQ